jgi:predicted Zn-dependent protease
MGPQITNALGVVDTETDNAAGNRIAEEITPKEEYHLGRAVGAAILSRYKIWQGDPELTNYLNEICATIVINSPRPEIYNGYHVVLLDSAEINAFASPGGHIFITRGLAACADSEDALAAILAHEIGHIQLRHPIKSITTDSMAAALRWGKNRLKELTDVMNESVREIVTVLVETGYSPEQEYDTDMAAMVLMASAGYDPAGLISLLERLEESGDNPFSGLATPHPSPVTRITKAYEAVVKFRLPDTFSYRTDRYGRITGKGRGGANSSAVQ